MQDFVHQINSINGQNLVGLHFLAHSDLQNFTHRGGFAWLWSLGDLGVPQEFPWGVFGDVLGYDSDRPKLPALTSWLWIPKLPKLKKMEKQNIWRQKKRGFSPEKKRQFFRGSISDLKHNMITWSKRIRQQQGNNNPQKTPSFEGDLCDVIFFFRDGFRMWFFSPMF